MTEFEPRLYIVMREDLWDMNPGKAMAQAAHAQADFDAYIEDTCGPNYTQNSKLWSNVLRWREDRNFGTTLVLSAPLDDMREINDSMFHSGMTFDPTYPYRNWYGRVFTSDEITCMWAFVDNDADSEFMKKFQLHP